MITRGKRLVVALVAMVLSLLALTGCSALGDPSTTEELLVRYAANPNNMNFTMKLDADVSVALSGVHTKVPVSMDAKCAGNTIKGTTVVDLSAINANNRTYEFYLEQQDTNFVAYLRTTTDDPGQWTRIELDCDFVIDIPAVVDILSQSKFLNISYDADKEVCFELILPASSVVKTLFGMGNITASFADITEDGLNDALGTSRLHVRFNKDCLVRSIELSTSFTYSDKDVIPVVANVSLDVSAVLDNYGTVDTSSVKIPDKVREAATERDDPFGIKEIANEIMESGK